MRLNIRRPISNQSITRGMRLIKTIVSEFFQMIPESFNFSTICIRMFNSPLNKFTLHFLHQVDFFLTYSLSKRIRLTSGKSANLFRNLHELLLINQNSICVFECILHMIFVISHRSFAMFSSDKFWNFTHWPRSIKCHHSNNILKL